MTTLSFKDFSKGGNVSVVGNEGKVLKNEKDNGNSFMEGLSRVASTYGKNLKEQAVGGVENAQKTMGYGVDTMQQAQQIPLDSGANKDEAIMTGAAGAAQIGVGAMSGVIQTAFSPLTALVMTGVQGYKELDEATGGNMKNQLTQVAQANPELIRNISDYVVQNPKKVQFASDMLNILTAGLGGKAVGEAGKDLTKGIVTGTKEAVGNIPAPSVPNVIKETANKVLPTSESIMQRVARIPKGEQAKFERITGESVGSYLDKRGIYGEPDKIVEQLYNRFQQSKSTADQALETIQGTYRSDVLRTTLKELEGKVQRTSSPGAPDSDLARISELVNKERTTGLSMPEINEVKRLYERKVKLGYMKEQNVDAIDRATNIDRSLREWQMKEAEKAGLTNLAEINKETQATRQLMDALGKEQAGIGGNNALGLTDAILVAGGSPESIASLLVKKTFSDKGVQSYVAKKISKNPVKQGVPEAQFKEKLQLPSPSGTTKVQIEVPISLLSKSESAIEQELIKNFGKKYTPAEIYEMANRLKELPAPKEGQTKVQIEVPIKMTPTRDVDISKGFSKTSKIDMPQSLEKVLQSSPQSTPTTPKSKGIRGMVNPSELNPFKKDPVYKNFTQDVVGTSKVEKGNLLNVKDSGRYAWRAGRDASLLVDNADLPDNAFRSIVGKSREDVISSLEENINKFNSEKGSVPPTDVKKINEVMDYVERVKSELVPKKKVVSSPVTVYHGSPNKFDSFDSTKLGSFEKDFPAKSGFWFSDSKATAASYGKNVKVGDLTLNNPKTIDADGATYGDFRDELRDAIETAKKEGNDGVIIKNMSDRKDWGNYEPATHYIAFDANNSFKTAVSKTKK